jgi:hypothetical protein
VGLAVGKDYEMLLAIAQDSGETIISLISALCTFLAAVMSENNSMEANA